MKTTTDIDGIRYNHFGEGEEPGLTRRAELSDLKTEMAVLGDDGDRYGHTMQWWFAACSILYSRGADIPDEWSYSPGAGGSPLDPDDYPQSVCDEYQSDVLLAFGEWLESEYTDCKAKGEDY